MSVISCFLFIILLRFWYEIIDTIITAYVKVKQNFKLLQIKFVEEESKLVAASAQRIRFEETWKLVGDWLKTAEGLERTNNGCTNYETIERQLEINKVKMVSDCPDIHLDVF